MAIPHISYDKNSLYGQMITRALLQLEQGLIALVDLLADMDQMKNDGVIDEYMRSKFGFPDVQIAQSGYDELSSLAAKLTTNNQVTDVNAALEQAFHKFS